MTRTYIGPAYPGTKLLHQVPGVSLMALGLITGIDVLAATGFGMMAVILYGNMKYQSYFHGTVEQYEVTYD